MNNSNFDVTKAVVNPETQEIESLEINNEPVNLGDGSSDDTGVDLTGYYAYTDFLAEKVVLIKSETLQYDQTYDVLTTHYDTGWKVYPGTVLEHGESGYMGIEIDWGDPDGNKAFVSLESLEGKEIYWIH